MKVGEKRGFTRDDLDQLNIVYWRLDGREADKRLAEAVRDAYYFCESRLDEIDRAKKKPAKKTDYPERVHRVTQDAES